MKAQLLVVMFILTILRLSVLAEGYRVPAAVALEGRGAIYAHIHSKIDKLNLGVVGESVPAPVSRQISRAELNELGFENGTFTELARAMKNFRFEAGQIVAQGPSWVFVSAGAFDTEGRQVFGGGFGSEPQVRKGGGYSMNGTFNWMPLISDISISAHDLMENGDVVELTVSTTTHWWSQTTHYYPDADGNFTVPISALTEGMVRVVTSRGNAWGYNIGVADSILKPVLGEELIVGVMDFRSSTFWTYVEGESPTVEFWYDQGTGHVYGEYPVIEIESTSRFERVVRINTAVPIRNHPEGKVSTNPHKLRVRSAKAGTSFDVSVDPTSGYFEIVLPDEDDIFQLFFTYPGVEGWGSAIING